MCESVCVRVCERERERECVCVRARARVTVQGSVVWREECGVVWCGVVWCGVVWCGVAWCGVVWRGVVWCGVVWSCVVWGGMGGSAKGLGMMQPDEAKRDRAGWDCSMGRGGLGS